MRQSKVLVSLAAVALLTACSSSSKAPASADAKPAPAQASAKAPDSRIDGNFPASSPFAKIKLGMTQGQVHEILGQPTDTKSYQTGKAWIPFYFGPDVMRTDEFYKGVGIITYTGAGIGGVHWTVHRAVYNANEDGYPDN